MYELDKPDNLVEMFENSVEKFAANKWLGTRNEEKNEYEWVTYKDTAIRIDNMRSGFAQLGIGKHDTVSVIANNCVEWAVACFATYGLGARFVPMYEAELASIWEYIIKDSNAKVLLVSKPEIYQKVKDFQKKIKGLDHVVMMYGKDETSMYQLEQMGRGKPVKSLYPDADDIAGLIYTSGTTGDPKGVLLSHGNFTSNVHAAQKAYDVLDENMRTLSFLPWAHSFGQTTELNSLMHVGGSTGFAESSKTIPRDLQLVRPNFLVGVPRVFNKVYDGVKAKINEKGGLARALFNMGINAGVKRRELAGQGKSNALANLKLALADKIVFKKIRQGFGGQLQYAMSASAALNPRVVEFFFDIGIPIFEAWGMTELSPAGSLSTPDDYKIGSVGKAIDKVKFAIDKSFKSEDPRQGELIVYGPNVMKGYHNKPKQTSAAFTDDGGLRTGDFAYIDDDGFLYITGRIKENFKLENGKFVYPAAIEEEIRLLPYVEQAMIYGINQEYTICIVYPDFDVMEKYAKRQGLPCEPEQMLNHQKIKDFFENKITKQLSSKFASYEIPKKFIFSVQGVSVENGLLTQTLKIKRREIVKRFARQIEDAYKEN
jgi:long-chain acyl-CoA synthetase